MGTILVHCRDLKNETTHTLCGESGYVLGLPATWKGWEPVDSTQFTYCKKCLALAKEGDS